MPSNSVVRAAASSHSGVFAHGSYERLSGGGGSTTVNTSGSVAEDEMGKISDISMNLSSTPWTFPEMRPLMIANEGAMADFSRNLM